jgi:hypothetical protein
MPRQPKKSQRKKTAQHTKRRDKQPSKYGSTWIVLAVAAIVALAMAAKGF